MRNSSNYFVGQLDKLRANFIDALDMGSAAKGRLATGLQDAILPHKAETVMKWKPRRAARVQLAPFEP